MKKLIALMLGLVLILSMSTTAFAAGEQTGTTTITAEVPEASYTIHIPANTTLEYGVTSFKSIGTVYVSDVTNVQTGIVVKIWATALCNGTNYIPVSYMRTGVSSEESGYAYDGESRDLFLDSVYSFNEDTYWSFEIKAAVDDADWHSAVPGTYTATLTFSFSVLAGDDD